MGLINQWDGQLPVRAGGHTFRVSGKQTLNDELVEEGRQLALLVLIQQATLVVLKTQPLG